MKKIAIVAPYKEYNYGTVLQAYALQQAVDRYGCSTEYLNFTNAVPLSLWKRIFKKECIYV